MFPRLFPAILRTLSRDRTNLLISVISLSLGLTLCFLVLLFIRDELYHNSSHPLLGRIYCMIEKRELSSGTSISGYTPVTLGPAAVESIPEVEMAARWESRVAQLSTRDNGITEVITFTDSSLFRMFNVPLVIGNPGTALTQPDDILLTSDIAERLFGSTEEAIGELITVTLEEHVFETEVAGIVADAPNSSSLQYQVLVNFVNYVGYFWDNDDAWNESPGVTFALLSEGADPREVEPKLNDLYRAHNAYDFKTPLLEPLSEAYLNSITDYSPLPKGNRKTIYILIALAAVVLALGCFNFTMLSISGIGRRLHEIGIRKAIGAHRWQILMQLFGETYLFALIAFALSMLLMVLTTPLFSTLVQRNLDLEIHAFQLWIGVFLFIIIGPIVGFYPALLLSRTDPVSIFRKTFHLSGNSWVGNALLVLQFSITIGMISSLIVMQQQMQHVFHTDLGFASEHVAVLSLGMGGEDPEQQLENLRSELLTSNRFTGISALSNAPGERTLMIGLMEETEDTVVQKNYLVFGVDEYIHDVLDIDLVDGRTFSEDHPSDAQHGVLVNETLVRTYGMENPVGQTFELFGEKEIIGVVEDFYFTSLHDEIQPSVFFPRNSQMERYIPVRYAYIRIAPGSIADAVNEIRAAWQSSGATTPLEIRFLDEFVEGYYENDRRWGKIITVTSVIAVLIGLIGLYGISANAANQRQKEISIRKVLGGNSLSLFGLLTSRPLLLILLSFLLATPITWYIMTQWLENFVFRVSLTPLPFVVAGVVTVLLALPGMGIKVWQTVRRNPVDSLRQE